MKGKLNGFQKLGFLLVALSAFVLLGSEWLARHHSAQAQALASEIKACLPPIVEGDPENYSNPAMPVLQLQEGDFSCLIEIISLGVSLPVESSWDSADISRFPHRFWGSVYDNSLILGGSNHKGQFDFCTKLDLGDPVLITDMTGTQFSYEVVRIDRRQQVDLDVLQEFDCDLTLFVRDGSSRNYIIVRCAMAA